MTRQDAKALSAVFGACVAAAFVASDAPHFLAVIASVMTLALIGGIGFLLLFGILSLFVSEKKS